MYMKYKRNQEIHKGQYGYIDRRKKSQGRKSILMFSISAAIFLLGLCLNDFSKSNIFTVVAAVSVLPAARMLTGFLVIAPYHSVAEASYNKVKTCIRKEEYLYTDVVCTSNEKVMNLAFLVITDGEVAALAGRAKEDTGYIKKYFTENLKKRALPFRVNIFSEEGKFIQYLESKSERKQKDEIKVKEDIKELKEYLESVML